MVGVRGSVTCERSFVITRRDPGLCLRAEFRGYESSAHAIPSSETGRPRPSSLIPRSRERRRYLTAATSRVGSRDAAACANNAARDHFSAALGGVQAVWAAATGADSTTAGGIIYAPYVSARSSSRVLGPAWAVRRRGPLDLELVVRAFAGRKRMLRGVLLRSLVAVWPPERFGRLVVLLDDTHADRVLGTALSNEQPRLVRAAFVNRTFPSKGVASIRGYHMQQYDTFWMDAFSAATFVGVVDADSLLVTPPHELDFFDEAGRPRVIPRVETPGGGLWAGSANASAYFVGAWLPRALRESGRPPR